MFKVNDLLTKEELAKARTLAQSIVQYEKIKQKMQVCDVCYGLKKYQNEICVRCNGTGKMTSFEAKTMGDNLEPDRNIYYEMFLNKYQHLVDENDFLTATQKEILRVLLVSESYFLSFCFDDEDYIYTEDKIKLVSKLLDGKWNIDVTCWELHDYVYVLIFDFLDKRPIENFCPVKCITQKKRTKKLEVFLPYHDFIKIYKKNLIEKSCDFWNQFWQDDNVHTKNIGESIWMLKCLKSGIEKDSWSLIETIEKASKDFSDGYLEYYETWICYVDRLYSQIYAGFEYYKEHCFRGYHPGNENLTLLLTWVNSDYAHFKKRFKLPQNPLD